MNYHRRNFVNIKKAIGTQWTSALERLRDSAEKTDEI